VRLGERRDLNGVLRDEAARARAEQFSAGEAAGQLRAGEGGM
jgi:hypothetical protein